MCLNLVIKFYLKEYIKIVFKILNIVVFFVFLFCSDFKKFFVGKYLEVNILES